MVIPESKKPSIFARYADDGFVFCLPNAGTLGEV